MKRTVVMVAFLTLAVGCENDARNKNKKNQASADATVRPVEEVVDVSDKALGILRARCESCHNADVASGNFGFVTDVNQMLASGKYLVAGDPDKSLVYTRADPAATGTMPPATGLSAGDREALRQWILTLDDPTGMGNQALALLETKCAGCHNAQRSDGGFNHATDIERMIAGNKYIVLSDIENSLLYTRTDPASPTVMPPGNPLSDQERGLLLQWLKTLKAPDTKEYLLSDEDYLKLIKNDLDKNVAPGAEAGVRYFTLHHLKVARVGEARIEATRQAFVKTINSLSLANTIVKPTAIDAERLIFRLNLFDINMPVETFEAFMAGFNPYTVDVAGGNGRGNQSESTYRVLAEEMGTRFFSVRIDWFVSTATMPIPYQRLLRLPPTLAELRTQWGVNTARNINENAVMRSGFANSGVSANNRVIERHVSAGNRFFWESYDFLNNDAIHNIFARPLGPSSQPFEAPFDQLFRDVAFTQDGGEMIFQLPNGFLGFYLSNAVGDYIHKGPLDVVRNKNGPESFLLSIVNGFSCMDCHKSGILNKGDQVRAFAQQSDSFSDEALDKILRLYPDPQAFTQVVTQDSNVFQNALKAAGLEATPSEDPVKTTLLHFYDKMSLMDAAAELGVSQTDILSLLRISPFREDWALLSFPGGTIQREQFNRFFGLAKESLRRGLDYVVPVEGDFFVTSACMQVNQLLMDACVSRNFGGLEVDVPPPPPAPVPQP